MPIRNPFEAFSFGIPRRTRIDQRFGSLFGQSGSDTSPPEEGFAGRDWQSYLSDLHDAMTTTGPAEQAYQAHLQNIPVEQPYTKRSRVAAALIGGAEGYQHGAGAGYGAARGVLDEPYQRDVEQYKLKEAGLARAADIEQKAAGRRVEFMREARGVSKDELEYRKYMMNEQDKARTAEETRRLHDAQIKNYERQGFSVNYVGEDKMRHVANPMTGEDKIIGPDVKGTELANEAERIRIARQNAGSARMGAQAQTINAQTGQSNLEIARTREGRLAEAEKARENAPILPSQQATARSQSYTRAAAYNPAWAKFINPVDGSLKLDEAAKDRQGFQQFMRRVQDEEQSIFTRTRQPGKIIE